MGDFSNVTCGENDNDCPIAEVPFYQLFGNSTAVFGLEIPTYHWFNLTYTLTMFSCACAVCRFLDVGPTRILERSGWRSWVGYFTAFFSVCVCLRVKSNGLGSGGYVMSAFYREFYGNENGKLINPITYRDKSTYIITESMYNCGFSFSETITNEHWCHDPNLPENRMTKSTDFEDFRFRMVIIWLIINMLPQFLYALWNLIAVVGTKFKDIRRIIFNYPQLLLCPTFSVYTFGAIHTNHWCYR